MLQHFLEQPGLEKCSSLRRVVCSGEALSPELTQRCLQRLPSSQLHNLYGPTEAAVDVTSFHCLPQQGLRSIPIGRPISNTSILILDEQFLPVPVGVPGELFIGGVQVGRGYLSRPELTAERFLPDPFSSSAGARLYRTGDKARWLPDGNIEYLGRLDFQVKVRGLRIELGEIEAALERHPLVRQAVVVVREDSPGDKRLVAYLVPPADDQAPDSSALRDFLKQKLPEYMVPSAFVSLEALPLNSSGKLDRKALPTTTLAERRGKKPYTAPSTPTEELLTRLWAQVLGVGQVGIHDNFFELGGDSLLAVSLVAMAAQEGLAFQVRQLFQHQTVAELAPAVSIAAPPSRAEQNTGAETPRVEEQLPLLPNYQWLVETFDIETQVWASTLVWDVPPETRVDLLRASMEYLGEQHDVLRLRLRRAPEGWAVRILASADEPHVEEHDLTGRTPQAQREAMLEMGRRLQSHLSITRGPTLALALCRLGGPGPDKLILSIHHCIYDAYSMPMLLADLYGTYQRLATGQPPQPPPVSATYRQYILAVAAHGRSSEAMREARAFWLDEARLRPGSPMPVDLGNGPHTDLNMRRLSKPIPPGLVSRLADYIRTHEDVSLNDLLLFGLARAWARWSGDLPLRLDVEHNGRAGVVPGVDLSRTLGPTTLKFPMRFEPKLAEPPQVAFASVKRAVRETMAHALDYGLLRFGPDEAVRQRMAACGSPQVFFNNRGATLGQPQRRTQVPGSAEAFAFPRADGKPSIVSYDLMIECDGAGSELQVTWVYSSDIHREETIRALAEDLYAQLAALLDAS
jgi:non-ribosomal peptide synthetase component F